MERVCGIVLHNASGGECRKAMLESRKKRQFLMLFCRKWPEQWCDRKCGKVDGVIKQWEGELTRKCVGHCWVLIFGYGRQFECNQSPYNPWVPFSEQNLISSCSSVFKQVVVLTADHEERRKGNLLGMVTGVMDHKNLSKEVGMWRHERNDEWEDIVACKCQRNERIIGACGKRDLESGIEKVLCWECRLREVVIHMAELGYASC